MAPFPCVVLDFFANLMLLPCGVKIEGLWCWGLRWLIKMCFPFHDHCVLPQELVRVVVGLEGLVQI